MHVFDELFHLGDRIVTDDENLFEVFQLYACFNMMLYDRPAGYRKEWFWNVQ